MAMLGANKDFLEILQSARNLLKDHYIPWYQYKDGGYCAVGAILHFDRGQFYQIVDLTNSVATKLHPELRGCIKPRLDNSCGVADHFDSNPTVFVNNQLGKEAILEVFDKAIETLEAELVPAVEEPVVINLKTKELVAA